MVELNRVYKGPMTFQADWKIGVVCSRFNQRITERLEEGCMRELAKFKVPMDRVQFISVPGAYEIPLTAKNLLDSGCSGVITLGAVIRGETSHYDYVCGAVDRGVSQLMLEYGRPVVFGILTTDTFEQAWERAGGSAGHKGEESVQVLLEMLSLQDHFQKLKKNQ